MLIDVFGVRIHSYTRAEIQQRLQAALAGRQARQLVTINPEFLLEARRNQTSRDVLNRADLAVADGFGLILLAALKGVKLERVTGADVVPWLIKNANSERLAVINWRGGLSRAEDIKAVIKKLNPKLTAEVWQLERGAKLPFDFYQFEPTVALISLGAPWQDLLAAELKTNLAGLKLVAGVGGSFDFLTGQVKRAPKILRALGLEWLWRLKQQPGRWRRIIKAVVIFPLLAIFNNKK